MCHTVLICITFSFGHFMRPELDLYLYSVCGLYLHTYIANFGFASAVCPVWAADEAKGALLTYVLSDINMTCDIQRISFNFVKKSPRGSDRRRARLASTISSGVIGWGRLTLSPLPASRGWRNTPAADGLITF